MTFSTNFSDTLNVCLGIKVSEETEDSLRQKLERNLEASIDAVQKRIGVMISEQDIVIPKEENNALYVAKRLYNEFMDTLFN